MQAVQHSCSFIQPISYREIIYNQDSAVGSLLAPNTDFMKNSVLFRNSDLWFGTADIQACVCCGPSTYNTIMFLL